MKILVGYDRSAVAKDALDLAKKHAKAFNAKVYLLTSLIRSHELQLEDIQKSERELENLLTMACVSQRKELHVRRMPSSALFLPGRM